MSECELCFWDGDDLTEQDVEWQILPATLCAKCVKSLVPCDGCESVLAQSPYDFLEVETGPGLTESFCSSCAAKHDPRLA